MTSTIDNPKLQSLLQSLENPKAAGDGYSARCPAHDDRNASLSIGIGDDGRLLLHCHAGCEPGDVLGAVGMTLADLMPSGNGHGSNGHTTNGTGKPKRTAKIYPTAADAIASLAYHRGEPAGVWKYHNQAGEHIGSAVRFNTADGKDIFAISRNGAGWHCGGMPEPRPLYQLPTLADEPLVVVTEGEKAADAARSIDLVATTSAMGREAAGKTDWSPLADKDVVLLPDNDDPGRAYMQTVAGILSKLSPPARVKVVALPGLPDGGDFVEFIEAHGEAAEPDSMRAEIQQLIDAAPEFVPGTAKPRQKRERKPAGSIGNPQTIDLREEPGRTDSANARRFAEIHRGTLKFIPSWNKWLAWDDRRFEPDQELAAQRCAKDVGTAIWKDVGESAAKLHPMLREELIRFAKYSANANGIRNMLTLAQSETGIPILPKMLDADPWLLNVENGTLDLRSMKLRPHRREDLITKLAPVRYDPDADCPLWRRVLGRITAGSIQRMSFLQRLAGYSLTGIVRDHVLAFLYGIGANGKSTFLGTLLNLLGEDYAMKAPAELLLAKEHSTHPTERADLHGKRLVACIENEEGKRLAESLAKEMTGGDKIRARRMREDFWEFEPTHKVWLAANHKPVIRGTDWGIWRRIKLVPFTEIIPDAEQDKALPEKLKAELPGILNWCLVGCAEWQADGLQEPEEVTQATADYRGEMDVLGRFIAECCIIGPRCKVKAGDLYAAYGKWCEAAGERAISGTRFGTAVKERGIEKERSSVWWYFGIGLENESTAAE